MLKYILYIALYFSFSSIHVADGFCRQIIQETGIIQEINSDTGIISVVYDSFIAETKDDDSDHLYIHTQDDKIQHVVIIKPDFHLPSIILSRFSLLNSYIDLPPPGFL